MYAIVEACGKQYKVQEGDILFIEKVDVEEGKKFTFDNVLLVSDGKKTEIGTPAIKDAKVEATVIGHGKGKKIVVFKYKAKKNERKKAGHRQQYTKIQIESIVSKLSSKETRKSEPVKAEEKKTVAKKTETEKKTETKTATKKVEEKKTESKAKETETK